MHRRLGPALPGDLGRPILNAGAAPNTAVPATTPDPEAQRFAGLTTRPCPVAKV
jgi:hypothetical protein